MCTNCYIFSNSVREAELRLYVTQQLYRQTACFIQIMNKLECVEWGWADLRSDSRQAAEAWSHWSSGCCCKLCCEAENSAPQCRSINFPNELRLCSKCSTHKPEARPLYSNTSTNLTALWTLWPLTSDQAWSKVHRCLSCPAVSWNPHTITPLTTCV